MEIYLYISIMQFMIYNNEIYNNEIYRNLFIHAHHAIGS